MKRKLLLLLTGLLVLSAVGCGAPQEPAGPSASLSTTVNTSESESSAENSGASQEIPSAETTESASSDVQEPQNAEPEFTLSLKELFAQHGMKTGTCLTPQMTSSLNSSKLILEQFNSITMENAMKPDAILSKTKSTKSGEIVVEFSKDMLKMLDWAKTNDMAVRGHTLVWYSQTPEWIFHEEFNLKKDLVSRDEMLSRMESMIRQVFEQLEEGGYSDLFYAYDVVNEAWMEDGTMRDNKWKTIIGDDYLWYAFYYANQYAPQSIDLYYNDYNEQFKAETLVNFVNTLVDENGNYLIDGIGLQAHLYTQDDLNGYLKAVEKLGSTGLKIQLTELDVCLGAWQNTLEANEKNLKVQGRYYYNLINGLFELADSGKIKMDALTFWGFADNMSWRREASPLLYDSTLTPKYSYYGAMQIREEAGFDN